MESLRELGWELKESEDVILGVGVAMIQYPNYFLILPLHNDHIHHGKIGRLSEE